jgi:hypothetical protein
MLTGRPSRRGQPVASVTHRERFTANASRENPLALAWIRAGCSCLDRNYAEVLVGGEQQRASAPVQPAEPFIAGPYLEVDRHVHLCRLPAQCRLLGPLARDDQRQAGGRRDLDHEIEVLVRDPPPDAQQVVTCLLPVGDRGLGVVLDIDRRVHHLRVALPEPADTGLDLAGVGRVAVHVATEPYVGGLQHPAGRGEQRVGAAAVEVRAPHVPGR